MIGPTINVGVNCEGTVDIAGEIAVEGTVEGVGFGFLYMSGSAMVASLSSSEVISIVDLYWRIVGVPVHDYVFNH